MSRLKVIQSNALDITSALKQDAFSGIMNEAITVTQFSLSAVWYYSQRSELCGKMYVNSTFLQMSPTNICSSQT